MYVRVPIHSFPVHIIQYNTMQCNATYLNLSFHCNVNITSLVHIGKNFLVPEFKDSMGISACPRRFNGSLL